MFGGGSAAQEANSRMALLDRRRILPGAFCRAGRPMAGGRRRNPPIGVAKKLALLLLLFCSTIAVTTKWQAGSIEKLEPMQSY